MPSGSIVFVDTSVLVCSEDGAHAGKRSAARAWLLRLWRERRGRLSGQVLSEFYRTVTRRLTPPMTPGDARAEVRRYQLWNPWLIDHPTFETAWAVEARYGFSWWDSLVVAAAQQQGCDILLTEDLQHDQRIDSLRIVDPFLVGPELLDAAPSA